MSTQTSPVPTELTLKKQTRTLVVKFADGVEAALSAEFLRVHSPSAEVQGHSAGEGMLVLGKENVAITRIEPVGRYAVRLVFDDGHDSGLFTWKALHEMCRRHAEMTQRYRDRVAAAAHEKRVSH
jgi:DUF971 family protein